MTNKQLHYIYIASNSGCLKKVSPSHNGWHEMDPYHLVPLGKTQSVLPSGQLVRLTIIHIINVFFIYTIGNIIIYSTDNNYHPDNMIIWMLVIIRTTFFHYIIYIIYIYMDLYGSIMIQIYGQLQLLCQPTQHGQQNHKGGSSTAPPSSSHWKMFKRQHLVEATKPIYY